jgi:hypothetical protein
LNDVPRDERVNVDASQTSRRKTGINAGGHACMPAACFLGEFFRFNGYRRSVKRLRPPSVHLRQRWFSPRSTMTIASSR